MSADATSVTLKAARGPAGVTRTDDVEGGAGGATCSVFSIVSRGRRKNILNMRPLKSVKSGASEAVSWYTGQQSLTSNGERRAIEKVGLGQSPRVRLSSRFTPGSRRNQRSLLVTFPD